MRREQLKAEASQDSTVQAITVMYCEPQFHWVSHLSCYQESEDEKVRWQDKTITAIINIIIIILLCVGSNHVILYIAMICVKVW